jgi:membrane protease YdiL (CAAX protease family)
MARKLKGETPRNLLTSLMLVFPLLILYQIGILFTGGLVNGADFITALVVHQFGPRGYMAFVSLVVAGFLVAAILLRRRQHFNARTVLPVLLESTIYALTMGGLILLVMTKILHLSPPRLGPTLQSAGVLTNFVMSIGAGVYEETVFRLGLLSGLFWVGERLFGLARLPSAVIAFFVSAAAFSLMHHVGPLGEPFVIGAFVFRLLAGLLFGLLFWFRGFAVAVYTHAIYDVLVLVLHR